eukprot:323097_1
MQLCTLVYFITTLFVIIKTDSPLSCKVNQTLIANVIESLSQDGYDIQIGAFVVNCGVTYLAANQGGAYGTYIRPIYNEHKDNLTYVYKMGAQTAILNYGCTPPSSAYFSWRTQVYDNNPEWVWANLGNSLNQFTIKTLQNTPSTPFDDNTIIITTADNKTYNDLHNILTQNEITSHEINLQSLPNKYIKFLPYKYSTNNINQYNHTYDTGSFLLRVALSENQNEYQQYIHTNQTIFLLHPKDVNPNNNIPNQPFDPVRRNIYSTKNVNESSVYLPIINEYEKDLINYFEITYNLTYINSRIFPDFDAQCNGIIDCGFSCIECNSNCGGDNRDGQYWQLNEIFPNYPHFYIIMGVIHTNLKQTLYSNIALEVLHDNSVSISDLDYNGSGLILPVKTNINKEYLENIFVVQLTNQELCVNEYKLPGFCNGTTGIIGDVAVMIRDYLNQNTKTRPNVNELVPPILIQFQKTK